MADECYSTIQSAQPRWAVISVYVIFATVIVSWTSVIMAMRESDQYESSQPRSSAMAAQAVGFASVDRHSQDRF